MSEHKWIGKQQGGDPAKASSYEWVRYCEKCGIEDTCEDPLPECEPMKFGVYRKTRPRLNPPEGHVSTGVGMLYQFLLLARNHYDGTEVVVYIPLRVEPEWAGTVRPCYMPRADFEQRFQWVGEGLPKAEVEEGNGKEQP